MACTPLLLDALHVLEDATSALIEPLLNILDVRADSVLPRQMRGVLLDPEYQNLDS